MSMRSASSDEHQRSWYTRHWTTLVLASARNDVYACRAALEGIDLRDKLHAWSSETPHTVDKATQQRICARSKRNHVTALSAELITGKRGRTRPGYVLLKLRLSREAQANFKASATAPVSRSRARNDGEDTFEERLVDGDEPIPHAEEAPEPEGPFDAGDVLWLSLDFDHADTTTLVEEPPLALQTPLLMTNLHLTQPYSSAVLPGAFPPVNFDAASHEQLLYPIYTGLSAAPFLANHAWASQLAPTVPPALCAGLGPLKAPAVGGKAKSRFAAMKAAAEAKMRLPLPSLYAPLQCTVDDGGTTDYIIVSARMPRAVAAAWFPSSSGGGDGGSREGWVGEPAEDTKARTVNCGDTYNPGESIAGAYLHPFVAALGLPTRGHHSLRWRVDLGTPTIFVDRAMTGITKLAHSNTVLADLICQMRHLHLLRELPVAPFDGAGLAQLVNAATTVPQLAPLTAPAALLISLPDHASLPLEKALFKRLNAITFSPRTYMSSALAVEDEVVSVAGLRKAFARVGAGAREAGSGAATVSSDVIDAAAAELAAFTAKVAAAATAAAATGGAGVGVPTLTPEEILDALLTKAVPVVAPRSAKPPVADNSALAYPTELASMFRPQANFAPLPQTESQRGAALLELALALDDSQRRAIVDVLSRTLSVIQGPPGTGKTQTIAHLAWLWAAGLGPEMKRTSAAAAALQTPAQRVAAIAAGQRMYAGRGRIFVTAFSNTAVNVIAERIITMPGCGEGGPIKVVRVGKIPKNSPIERIGVTHCATEVVRKLHPELFQNHGRGPEHIAHIKALYNQLYNLEAQTRLPLPAELRALLNRAGIPAGTSSYTSSMFSAASFPSLLQKAVTDASKAAAAADAAALAAGVTDAAALRHHTTLAVGGSVDFGAAHAALVAAQAQHAAYARQTATAAAAKPAAAAKKAAARLPAARAPAPVPAARCARLKAGKLVCAPVFSELQLRELRGQVRKAAEKRNTVMRTQFTALTEKQRATLKAVLLHEQAAAAAASAAAATATAAAGAAKKKKKSPEPQPVLQPAAAPAASAAAAVRATGSGLEWPGTKLPAEAEAEAEAALVRIRAVLAEASAAAAARGGAAPAPGSAEWQQVVLLGNKLHAATVARAVALHKLAMSEPHAQNDDVKRPAPGSAPTRAPAADLAPATEDGEEEEALVPGAAAPAPPPAIAASYFGVPSSLLQPQELFDKVLVCVGARKAAANVAACANAARPLITAFQSALASTRVPVPRALSDGIFALGVGMPQLPEQVGAEPMRACLTMLNNHLNGVLSQKPDPVLSQKLQDMIWKAQQGVIDSADIVLATCVGAGQALVQETPRTFTLVIVDEASQAPESSVVIPLTVAARDARAVLVGDQCQLPPTSRSRRMHVAGATNSMFERLLAPSESPPEHFAGALQPLSMCVAAAQRAWVSHSATFIESYATTLAGDCAATQQLVPLIVDTFTALTRARAELLSRSFTNAIAPSVLRVQYRMHVAVSAWPSRQLYDGRVTDGITPHARRPPPGFPWLLLSRSAAQLARDAASDARAETGLIGAAFHDIYRGALFARPLARLFAARNCKPLSDHEIRRQLFRPRNEAVPRGPPSVRTVATSVAAAAVASAHSLVPVVFLDVRNLEQSEMSPHNLGEAAVVTAVVASLLCARARQHRMHAPARSSGLCVPDGPAHKESCAPLMHGARAKQAARLAGLRACGVSVAVTVNRSVVTVTPPALAPASPAAGAVAGAPSDPRALTKAMRGLSLSATPAAAAGTVGLDSVLLPLLGPTVGAEDIGVVCPYQGQVRFVRFHLEALERRLAAHPFLAPRGLAGDIEVQSVDGFQGREKEVIILSCTRSNLRGSLGFVQDVRRLNVALTRAKRGLVVIGNVELLSKHGTWRSFLTYLDERGLIIDAREVLSHAHMLGAELPPMRVPGESVRALPAAFTLPASADAAARATLRPARDMLVPARVTLPPASAPVPAPAPAPAPVLSAAPTSASAAAPAPAAAPASAAPAPAPELAPAQAQPASPVLCEEQKSAAPMSVRAPPSRQAPSEPQPKSQPQSLAESLPQSQPWVGTEDVDEEECFELAPSSFVLSARAPARGAPAAAAALASARAAAATAEFASGGSLTWYGLPAAPRSGSGIALPPRSSGPHEYEADEYNSHEYAPHDYSDEYRWRGLGGGWGGDSDDDWESFRDDSQHQALAQAQVESQTLQGQQQQQQVRSRSVWSDAAALCLLVLLHSLLFFKT